MIDTQLPVQTAEPLARSLLYQSLALVLHPPLPEVWQRLTADVSSINAVHASELLAGSIPESGPDADPEVQRAATHLRTQMRAWRNLRPDWDTFHAAHRCLFGHTPRGAVCPYETEYGQDGLFGLPHRLANLRGLYEAFGLTVRQRERERPDHISCELEFMEFLCTKEVYACEQRNLSMKEETRRAARLFLKEHLGRFGRAFGRELQRHDPEGFLGVTGSLLFDFLTLECGRFRLEAGPPTLPLRSTAEDDVPMACGGDELVELES